jgi:L-seryl-tRNA(Ser) seleniumtransferase
MAPSLRSLPSVDRLLADPRLAGVPRPLALAAARAALDRARDAIRAGADPGDPAEATLAELAAAGRPSLRRVLNATGVLVHTNLGRSPLAAAALQRVVEVGGSYSNLEYDLDRGARGSRQDHLGDLLRRLTGAEAGLVVNNNAGAVMLALAALAEGREVLVSRGELIEIGDGFRIPDVLARSGARLVEVGTTNRTRAADYERAIGPDTAVILRVHQSNFRVVGFTEQPGIDRLAEVARAAGIPLVDDLGSGALFAVGDESTPTASLEAGADIVCFSGDKLLGGPQAGILVGRADLIECLRRHPLQRALRADKLTLAALEGTLSLALDPERARREIPVLRMLAEPVEEVRARAERLAHALGGELEETVARVGGGALPLAELPSFACAVEEPLFDPLRAGEPPVVGIVRDGRLLLDVRALADGEVDEVVAAVAAARALAPPA